MTYRQPQPNPPLPPYPDKGFLWGDKVLGRQSQSASPRRTGPAGVAGSEVYGPPIPPELQRQMRLPSGEIIEIQWVQTTKALTASGFGWFPILPMQYLNAENLYWVMSQTYGDDWDKRLKTVDEFGDLTEDDLLDENGNPIDFYSILTGLNHLSILAEAEKAGIPSDEIYSNQYMLDYVENWAGSRSGFRMGEGGQFFSDEQAMNDLMSMRGGAPKVEQITTEGMPWQEHFTRMEKIRASTGQDPRALYKQDLQLMEQAMRTGKPVQLTTGVFDPKSDGFREQNPTERPGEQGNYIVRNGVTYFVPDVVGWSFNAYQMQMERTPVPHGQGEVKGAIQEGKKGELLPEEWAQGVAGGPEFYPKQKRITVSQEEAAQFEKRNIVTSGVGGRITGQFDPSGMFIEETPSPQPERKHPIRTPEQEEWASLVARHKKPIFKTGI